jgi:hypothetical protein
MVKKFHFSLDKTNSMLYTINTMRHRRNVLHRKTFLITGLQMARLERLAKETDQNLFASLSSPPYHNPPAPHPPYQRGAGGL